MKRTLVFLLLGPMFGIFGAWSYAVIAGGGLPRDFGEGAAMAFLFGLVVSVATGPVDGYFAHVLPIALKAPLTAIVGATISVGMILYFEGKMMHSVGKMMPLHFPTEFAVLGAICMSMCSLLAHDYRS